ncbi:hypothetical protein [Marinoscillum furvescens]|uniref:Uncharacterized protein n=1 Tax=Marinoscillum furvescens DSM 4134 TaxID=1122208 RepID=A0A3D9L1I2_MARFU|nr:hypothetical protein [Marinoscillum furvescens]RED97916.1 hypothetical protein C7460_11157 [Marinoscillum furvescens DSM 4134]
MRKSLLHIILCSILAFAVTDYIWLEMFHEDIVCIDLELEKEKEQENEEEKLKETEHHVKKELLLIGLYLAKHNQPKLSIGPGSGYIKNGNSFAPDITHNKPPKYLEICQIIIYS